MTISRPVPILFRRFRENRSSEDQRQENEEADNFTVGPLGILFRLRHTILRLEPHCSSNSPVLQEQSGVLSPRVTREPAISMSTSPPSHSPTMGSEPHGSIVAFPDMCPS